MLVWPFACERREGVTWSIRQPCFAALISEFAKLSNDEQGQCVDTDVTFPQLVADMFVGDRWLLAMESTQADMRCPWKRHNRKCFAYLFREVGKRRRHRDAGRPYLNIVV